MGYIMVNSKIGWSLVCFFLIATIWHNCCLAVETHNVISGKDDETKGTLRWAIEKATTGDNVLIEVPSISLSSPLKIKKGIHIYPSSFKNRCCISRGDGYSSKYGLISCYVPADETLYMINLDFRGGRALNHGGAIHNYDTPGKVVLDACTFTDNATTNVSNGVNLIANGGGAIYNQGCMFIKTSFTATGNYTAKQINYLMQGNSSAHGGAIYNSGLIKFDQAIVTMNGNYTGNGGNSCGYGGSGGAIRNDGTIIFDTCVLDISNNNTGNGGMLDFSKQDPPQYSGCGGDGGAIDNTSTSVLEFTSCTGFFKNNHTGKGGDCKHSSGAVLGVGNGGDGGAINNSGTVRFASSKLNFTNNYTGKMGIESPSMSHKNSRKSCSGSGGAINTNGLLEISGKREGLICISYNYTGTKGGHGGGIRVGKKGFISLTGSVNLIVYKSNTLDCPNGLIENLYPAEEL
jgi:hypothetical protein